MSLAVITAIYGDYEHPKPLTVDGFDDAVMVTDTPTECAGWRNVVRPHHAHPNTAAKVPKLSPHLFTDCDTSVWVDASMHVLDQAAKVAGDVLDLTDLAQFDHPGRNDLYDEALFTSAVVQHRYLSVDLVGQAQHYLDVGMPRAWGLWATGVIVRRHTQELADWGAQWLGEIQRWGYQDQVSHPYVCWRTGIRPMSLPGTLFINDIVQLGAHK